MNKTRTRLLVMLMAVFSVLGFSAAYAATPAHAAVPVNITTTLYAYPTDAQWTQVTGSTPAGTVNNSIVNICDTAGHGPGCDGTSWTNTNQDWVSEIARLRTAHIQPLVYIPTNYGAYSIAKVEGWLNNAISRYGTYAPMFDTMAPSGTCTNGGTSMACTTYYKTLYNYVVSKNGLKVMFNPGTSFGTSSADVFGTRELLDVFEGPATTQGGQTGFESMVFPTWMKSFAPSYFVAVISAGTSSTVSTDIADAGTYGIGNFYEDDEAEPNPNYSTLPSFWSAEVTDAANGI